MKSVFKELNERGRFSIWSLLITFITKEVWFFMLLSFIWKTQFFKTIKFYGRNAVVL